MPVVTYWNGHTVREMDTSQETLYAIALAHAGYYCPTPMAELYRRLGSATAVVEQRAHLRECGVDVPQRLADALRRIDESVARAEREMEFCAAHSIRPLPFHHPGYPERLRQCPDAPLLLFCRGTAPLNRRRVVSIVGTRHATVYARDVVHHFVHALRKLCPDVLIVSGLAYGVDIVAHREALAVGYDTVGVLAHGLDTIYPSAHRDTAALMTRQGALLTEFLTHTNADKRNFVRRNRIVAGMADACILVESAAKGGGLITMELARGYHREVFAFPGSVLSGFSDGCNNLIREQKAAMLTSADEFAELMHWKENPELKKARASGIERQLFPELDADEQLIVDALQRCNDQQLNILAARLQMPVQRISSAVFTLEMKGVTSRLAGSVCHLI